MCKRKRTLQVMPLPGDTKSTEARDHVRPRAARNPKAGPHNSIQSAKPWNRNEPRPAESRQRAALII